MPSKSKAQHNLMAMVANDPAAAKRVGIPRSVGEEYMQADKGKKFGGGTQRARPDLQKVNKPSTRHGKSELFSGGGMPVKPMTESKVRSQESDEAKRKVVGGQEQESYMAMPTLRKKSGDSSGGMKKGGMAKYAKGGSVGMSKMGSVRTAAPSRDGVAMKGKTKGTMVKMKRGGKC